MGRNNQGAKQPGAEMVLERNVSEPFQLDPLIYNPPILGSLMLAVSHHEGNIGSGYCYPDYTNKLHGHLAWNTSFRNNKQFEGKPTKQKKSFQKLQKKQKPLATFI